MWMRVAKVRPGQVLLVSGDRGLRLLRAGRTLVWSGERVTELSLSPVTVGLHLELDVGGGSATLRGQAQLSVNSASNTTLTWAALQTLDRGPGELMNVALRLLEGHLRAQLDSRRPIGADETAALAAKVGAAAANDLASMGLRLGSIVLDELRFTPVVSDGQPGEEGQPSVTTLVTTNNPHVLKELGTRGFDRLHLVHLVANSGAEAVELVRRYHPTAALIDFVLPDGDGFRVCQAIKADSGTSKTRVVLLTSNAVTRAQLRRIEECGCDDLLSLPAASGELREHLACLVGAPFRRSRRTRVALAVTLQAEGRAVGGRLVDLSDHGARVEVDAPLDQGTRAEMRPARSAGEGALRVQVIWSRSEPCPSVGLAFEPRTEAEVRAVRDLCPWTVEENDDGLLATLNGDLVEDGLDQLASHLVGAKTITFDASNALDVPPVAQGPWRAFLDGLAGRSFSFIACPAAFVRRAAPMLGLGFAAIRSVRLTYRCRCCETEEARVLQLAALPHEDGRPATPLLFECPVCCGELRVIESEEDCLAA